MKLRNILYLTIASVVLWTGCEYDNFDPPESDLVGQILYNGEPVGVRSNEVELELWQDGFDLRDKIPVMVAQDGSFSAKLFDGEYKLTMRPGDGPWVERSDTVTINLKGHAEVEYVVEPYYIIDNVDVTHSGGDITADFDVLEITDTREIEFVALYVSTTTIVDNINNEGRVELFINDSGDRQDENLALTLGGALNDRAYIFARIGVKTSGIADLIFSEVQKVEL